MKTLPRQNRNRPKDNTKDPTPIEIELVSQAQQLYEPDLTSEKTAARLHLATAFAIAQIQEIRDGLAGVALKLDRK